MHNKKPLREVVPINEGLLDFAKKKLPTEHTPEGIKEYPDEAARQADNYHNYAFTKKRAYPDYDPKFEKPEMLDPDTQDKAARDAHYKQYGLKRMTIRDAQENPHYMAKYLNHMQKHFPEVAEDLNHTPINQEQNRKMEGKDDEYVLKHRYPNPIKRMFARIKNKVEDLEWKIAPQRAQKRQLEGMTAAVNKLKNDPTLKQWDHEYNEGKKKEIEDWHANNTDLHHLSGSQVYQHYRHDYFNDESHSGLTVPADEKVFTKHWDKINKK